MSPAAAIRVRKGRPDGGEFVAHPHAEAELEFGTHAAPQRISHQDRWAEVAGKYATWVQDHGQHPRSPPAGLENQLAQWASGQRRKREQLTDDQVGALNAVPGWRWSVTSAGVRAPLWEERADDYETWTNDHGKPLLSSADPSERLMARWSERQRSRRDVSSAQQNARLERIPGWVWPTRESFNDRAADYHNFVATQDRHPSSDGKTPEEQMLGRWATAQRRRSLEVQPGTTMTADERAALEAIPGWTWDRAERVTGRRGDYEAWTAKWGRQPQKSSSDATERSIANWVSDTRRHRNTFSDDQQQANDCWAGSSGYPPVSRGCRK